MKALVIAKAPVAGRVKTRLCPPLTHAQACLLYTSSANEAALEIIDEAMRVCGGAAFSKHLPNERYFRDARAGHVMAPTADVLYDLYARVLCGMELFA